ncbi:MAG: AI-2E family transporter, partial [Alphaproteobacteria bacterium]|nr:AI-2E family transporter [Alphaproteobacteria bacterium]
MPQSTLPTKGGDQTVDKTSAAGSRGLRNVSPLVPMLTVLTAGAVLAFLYFARDVIIPITLGILLSFLLAPAVRWLRRLRIGRVPAVMLTVLAAFLAIFGFAATVVHETTTLAQELPEYRYNLETKVRSLPGSVPGNGVFHRLAGMFIDLRNELTKSETDGSTSARRQSPLGASSGGPAKPVPVEIRQPELQPLQLVESIIEPLLQPLAMAGLVVVFAVMILLEREDLRDRLLRLAGRDLHRTTVAMDDAAQRISRYLLRQLVVNACVGVPIGFGLALIGIPNAALWGILSALLRFVPYLGIVIAACFPVALAIAVDPGWMLLVWVVLLFVGIELVVSNLLEPWVYGAGTGLSPVALIAAATFWTWLWGPIGLLLSTPMTVCLVVLGRHVPQLEFLDVMLGSDPVLAPSDSFYQRLLANDPEEATEQAREFIREGSVAEFFDRVVVPALERAQADSDRGVLSAERRTIIVTGIRAMLEDLADDAAPNAEAEQPLSLRTEEPAIVCVAGRNQLDEAAALLLVHLLRAEHHPGGAEALPADALAPDVSSHSLFRYAELVCLSLISTGSPARARYLERRLRRRAPRAKVLVGFWGLAESELAAAATTMAEHETIAVSSLRDAM